MDATSIITQVSRDDEQQLNSSYPNEKGKRRAYENVLFSFFLSGVALDKRAQPFSVGSTVWYKFTQYTGAAENKFSPIIQTSNSTNVCTTDIIGNFNPWVVVNWMCDNGCNGVSV